MVARKIALLSAVAVLMGCVTLAGCGDGKATSDVGQKGTATSAPDPNSKFDQPVNLNLAKVINTQQTPPLPNGDTLQKNQIFDYIKNKTNVQINYSWQVETLDTFNQKLSLSMANHDLPDAFTVNQQQLQQLTDAGMLADLTNVYAQYASPLIKSYYATMGDRVFQQATFNGKLMALPSINIGDQFALCWIRQDWLDKLGLKQPKTLDELVNVAKAFTENDPDGNSKNDTYGIEANNALSGWNSAFTLEPIMGAMHAYKGLWMADSSGKPVYSSTLPEMKNALSMLHDLFAKGYIDKEFVVNQNPKQPVTAGKIGIVFGPWWISNGTLADSMKTDPKANWVPILAPFDEKGKFNTYQQNPNGNFLVVRKDYANPAAAMKAMNYQVQGSRHLDPESNNLYQGQWFSASYWPFNLQLDNNNTVYDIAQQLQNAWSKKDPSGLNTELKGYYDSIKTYADNPKDIASWGISISRLTGSLLTGAPSVNIQPVVFYGQTKSMPEKWATLQTLESQTFLKIIVGDQPVSSFDDFVVQWKKIGGDQITQEIAQAIKK